VREFLSYEDWRFIVMPPGMMVGLPFKDAGEFFEFADQLLSVRPFGFDGLLAINFQTT
jgi:hypothetical protein